MNDTPLDVQALGCIVFVLFAESVSVNSLNPIYPELASHYYSPAQVGMWATSCASAYYAGQLLSSPIWGRLADRYGPRRTLLWACIGCLSGFAWFGLSRTFRSACFARFFSGIFCGLNPVGRATLGLLSDNTNAHKIMSITSYANGFARLLGPLYGGLLADPAEFFPSTFSAQIWSDFPYLLISIVNMSIYGLATFLLWSTFKDPVKQQKANISLPGAKSYGGVDQIDENDNAADWSTPFDFTCSCLNRCMPREGRRKFIFVVITSSFLSQIPNFAITSLFSTYCESYRNQGGMALSVRLTGTIAAIDGFSLLVWQQFFYNRLVKSLGTKATLQVGQVGIAIGCVLIPFITWVDQRIKKSASVEVIIMLAVVQVLRAVAGSTAVNASQVMLQEVTPR